MRLLLALTVSLLVAPVHAQEYPNRPVRLIVAFPPGGAVDLTGRILGKHLGEALGQPVVIDNKPGAGGIIATEAAAKAKPDGYTLYLSDNSPFVINPLTYRMLPYDAVNDFLPISLIAYTTHVLVANAELVPANSLAEFVAFVKANPGKIDYASSGTGGAHHLSMELFKSAAGLEINHVPYKGGAPALQDVVGGRVHAMFSSISTFIPQRKSGRLKAYAVGSPKRSALVPDLATLSELGYPGVDAQSWFGVVGPKGIPNDVSDHLQRTFARVTQLPAFGEQLASTGLEPYPGTPEQFSALIRRDIDSFGPVIRRLNLRSD
ncbi:MAG TPA: tripartite tricarboxylate transporter substrate binding protein [Burkholderiales bacterium]|nr:tripartite tricarboxylate transporter substrate binding protein [Burkholderiales bacterium]